MQQVYAQQLQADMDVSRRYDPAVKRSPAM